MRGRKRLYDWGRWFTRERFTLRRGADFACEPASMAQQLRNAASARGLWLVVTVDGNEVRVSPRVDIPKTVGA